jgi:hypothetical protein
MESEEFEMFTGLELLVLTLAFGGASTITAPSPFAILNSGETCCQARWG